MRRIAYLLGALFLCQATLHAQEIKRVAVQEGTNIKNVIHANETYAYPQFTAGNVFFKEGTQSSAKLNYNLLLGQVQFIDHKGDTLSVDNESTIRQITIGVDTFYFDKEYLKLINGNGSVKLAMNQRIRIADRQKTGAYGQPVSRSSVSSYNRMFNGSQVTNLSVMQQVSLATDKKYYIGDRFYHFVLLNKKNLVKMFSKHQSVIEEYLKENRVSFTEEADVLKLFSFIQGLSN